MNAEYEFDDVDCEWKVTLTSNRGDVLVTASGRTLPEATDDLSRAMVEDTKA